MSARRIVVLTEGHSNPVTAKTATSVVRYQTDQVSAVLDSTQAGKTSQQVLGVGGDIPVVASLDDAPPSNTLLIGIAPPGGKLPGPWKAIVIDAARRGMDIVSGLHDFLSNDPEIAQAAKDSGVTIHDVRKNNEKDVSNRQGIRAECLRIHTVGHDCSIGKMVASIEIARELTRQGYDAKFIATGQTGIMIEGDGCPVDCVVSDFVNGAVEKLILAHQHHDFLLIEGQGSIAHPRYSAVTAGLLHGCIPQGLVMTYEAGREHVGGMPGIPLTPLGRLMDAYVSLANLHSPTEFIGVAMNSRLLTPEQAEVEREKVSNELGLPVVDVLRHGAGELVKATLALRDRLGIAK